MNKQNKQNKPNPPIYKCCKCGNWEEENNITWANPKGGEIKSKTDEKPFCNKCMPDEP